MKKLFFVFAALMGSLVSVQAQDLITMKNGDDVEAKIIEVSPKEVKYKKFSNLDGPTFTVNKSDILIIRYENGEKDIFDEVNSRSGALGDVYEGMRYRDYKNLYDTHYYIHEAGDAYSPGWAGVASFFIPGLGQGVAGEWGRGLGIFAADLGLSALFYGSVATLSTYENETTGEIEGGGGASLLAVGAIIGKVVLDIWSICDAVHVAKVKNMYQQDIRSQRAAFDVKVVPYLASTQTSVSGYQPTAGLSLKVNF